MPVEWFEGQRLQGSNHQVTVFFRLETSLTRAVAGVVNLHPKTTFSVSNDVVLVLPDKPVHRGEEFAVPLYAYTAYTSTAFSLLCDSSGNLEIVSAAPNASWTGTTRRSSQQNVGVVALLQSPEKASGSIIQRDKLLDVRLKASTATTSTAASANISCTLHYLSNIRSDVMRPRGLSLPTVFSAVGGSNGELQIAERVLRGVVVTAERAELVNTAILTGESVASSVSVLAVYSDNTQQYVIASACGTSSEALHVSQDCRSVYLDGTETTGGAAAGVWFTFASANRTLTFRVWSPTNHSAPVDLSLSPQRLGKVSGWQELVGSVCVQQYQRSQLQATTQFTFGSGTPMSVSVLHLIASSLQSSNPVVASVSNTTGLVQGYSPGTAYITAFNGQTQLGSVAVVVDDQRVVSPTGLSVAVATSIVLTLPTGQYGRLSRQVAVAGVRQKLDFEGVNGSVSAVALFSDGSRLSLSPELGLHIRSLNTAVVTTAGDQVQAVSNGKWFVG